MRRTRWFAAAVAAGLAVFSGLSLWAWHTRDDSLDRVRERGEIRIGFAIEPPFALLRNDGTPGGESVEVARTVAQRLGVRPIWVLTDFDRLIPELNAERFDMIAAGLFITPHRMQRVHFSRPTLRVRPGWLRRASAPGPVGTYAEAGQRPGLRVAVVRGSVEAAAFESGAERKSQLLVVPDARAGREAVMSGRSDALALSMPTVALMAAESSGQLVAEAADGPGVSEALVGLAVRREDKELAQAVDLALDGYLGQPEHLGMLGGFGLGVADLPEAPHVER